MLANHHLAEKCVSKAGFIALAWHCCQALAREQNGVAKPTWRNGPGCVPVPPCPQMPQDPQGLGRLWGGAACPAPPSLHPGAQAPVSRGAELSCEQGVKLGAAYVFPRHFGAHCTCKPPQAQLGLGPALRDSGSRCPLLLHAARWGWGQRFREHWTTAGPLPHPAGQEFALLSNSAGFRAKRTPKLPLFPLLSGLCFGLACSRGAKLPLSHSACWPVAPATCPWVLLGAEQGLGGLSGPHLPTQRLPGVQAGEHLASC